MDNAEHTYLSDLDLTITSDSRYCEKQVIMPLMEFLATPSIDLEAKLKGELENRFGWAKYNVEIPKVFKARHSGSSVADLEELKKSVKDFAVKLLIGHDFSFDYMLGAAFADGMTGAHGIVTAMQNGFFFPGEIKNNRIIVAHGTFSEWFTKHNPPERYGIASLIQDGILAWAMKYGDRKPITLPKKRIEI